MFLVSIITLVASRVFEQKQRINPGTQKAPPGQSGKALAASQSLDWLRPSHNRQGAACYAGNPTTLYVDIKRINLIGSDSG
jgi:hypothetical protein